jgi:hypothetical protein
LEFVLVAVAVNVPPVHDLTLKRQASISAPPTVLKSAEQTRSYLFVPPSDTVTFEHRCPLVSATHPELHSITGTNTVEPFVALIDIDFVEPAPLVDATTA